MRRAWILAGMLLCAGVWAQPGRGGGVEPPRTEPPKADPADVDLEGRAIAALRAGEWDKAEELLRRQIDLGQGRFVPYYNMACVRSTRGDVDGAHEWLVKALERGFCDLRQLRRDPYLAAYRRDERFAAIEAGWGRFLQRRIETDVAAAKDLFGGSLVESRDDRLRLVYLSSYDEKAFVEARADVERVAAWCDEHLWPGLMREDEASLDAWVMVALPAREAFVRWTLAEFGPAAISGFGAVGGMYVHDEKRLVSQDLGATLRHEFFHVQHWRHMTRLGQRHPAYVQEGLGSLVEDFEVQTDGRIRIVPSWRTNIAKRREHGGTLMTIKELAGLAPERFTGSRPLANYAMARTLFMFVHERGLLRAWYEHYTGHFLADPSGLKSFEAVFGKPAAEIQKEYRAWVRALPEVAEEIQRGMASLGVEIEAGEGDGVRVSGITTGAEDQRIRRRPTTLAGVQGELRVGDVMRSIEGKPTREMAELVRVLSGFKPGDEVRIEVRRGRRLEEVRVKLTAKG